jgi:hypothetical protein
MQFGLMCCKVPPQPDREARGSVNESHWPLFFSRVAHNNSLAHTGLLMERSSVKLLKLDLFQKVLEIEPK